jgi:hypothetical protein
MQISDQICADFVNMDVQAELEVGLLKPRQESVAEDLLVARDRMMPDGEAKYTVLFSLGALLLSISLFARLRWPTPRRGRFR